jgi:hypothetical protein
MICKNPNALTSSTCVASGLTRSREKEPNTPYPDFINAFPAIDVPFPEDVVQTAVVRSDDGLVPFFTFLKDMELPLYSHGAQWGTVVEGQIKFTIGLEAKLYSAGGHCQVVQPA